MNNTQTFKIGEEKNIVIFDGASDIYQFKKEFEFANEKFSRDLTGQAKSSVEIYDPDDIVKKYDIFIIGAYFNFTILGKVYEIKYDIITNQKVLTLVWGADTHNNEYYNADLTFNPNGIVENNYQALDIEFQTTTSVSFEKNINSVDVIARNLMLINNHREFMENKKIEIQETFDNSEYKIRLDDPSLSNQNANFGKTVYNALRIYRDNDSFKADYYIDQNNEVTQDINLAQKPIVRKVEVGDKIYYDENYAENKLNSMKFQNEISFDVNFDNDLEALKFDNTFLGRKLKIYIDDFFVNSIISKFIIQGQTINVVCGLSRERFTDLINKD